MKMVRNSVVTFNFFIDILLAVVHVSATPGFKGTLLKLLTDANEDKTLAYIVALPHDTLVHVPNTESYEKNDKKDEINDDAVDLLQQLLKPRKKYVSRINLNLRSLALRTNCKEKSKCLKKCTKKKKKPCQQTCQIVHDAYNQCEKTSTKYVVDACSKTTKKDPCQKWGKTLPPHWRSLLRAWNGGKEDYGC